MATATTTIRPLTDTTAPAISARRVTAALLIAQFVLMFATLGILTPAINWPASLDEPASVVLPLIVQQQTAVALGYTSYFVSALLLIPIALLVAHLLQPATTTWIRVATGFGVLAGFAKLIGIGRWLLLMPALASSYVDPAATSTTREALAVAFTAFNAFAGGVGEVLGVMLFSGLWTVLLAIGMLRSARFPRWLGVFGLLAGALLLIGLVDVFGVALGPILIVQGVVWQFWMLAFAIVLIRNSQPRR